MAHAHGQEAEELDAAAGFMETDPPPQNLRNLTFKHPSGFRSLMASAEISAAVCSDIVARMFERSARMARERPVPPHEAEEIAKRSL